MTPEEREAERIRNLAAAVYGAMDRLAEAETYIRQITAKHGTHPAFTKYMTEMLLKERLAEVLARPKLTRG